jgi:hypothetical protein
MIAEGGKLNPIEVLCLTLNDILKDFDQKINFITSMLRGMSLMFLLALTSQNIVPASLLSNKANLTMIRPHQYC